MILPAVATVFALVGLTKAVTPSLSSPAELSLDEMPSVKFHVTIKRKTMKFHEQSEFDIYATPVVSPSGASALYNSYATFHDGDTEFTYTLVNRSGYLTTTDALGDETIQCLPPDVMPFDEILPALNNATPITSASIGGKPIACESGNLFKTIFVGTQYTICVSNGTGFTAFSSDLDIAVEYLEGTITVLEPELTDKSASCAIVQKATYGTRSGYWV
ncbi:hypothetical protein PInf_021983 [Phytophthora infestans]|nr:hypothetical protein PInf_021983 [Phytophthora infestans]